MPVTTACSHNICLSCLKRSFDAETFSCSACRFHLHRTVDPEHWNMILPREFVVYHKLVWCFVLSHSSSFLDDGLEVCWELLILDLNLSSGRSCPRTLPRRATWTRKQEPPSTRSFLAMKLAAKNQIVNYRMFLWDAELSATSCLMIWYCLCEKLKTDVELNCCIGPLNSYHSFFSFILIFSQFLSYWLRSVIFDLIL